MKFVGAIWKLLVGIKDALVLLLLIIFFAGVYGMLSARPAPVRDGVLDLELNGSVVEQPARRQWSDVAAAGRIDQYRLRDLVAALGKAKDDSAKKTEAKLAEVDGAIGAKLAEAEARIAKSRSSAVKEIEAAAADLARDITMKVAGIDVAKDKAASAVKAVMSDA